MRMTFEEVTIKATRRWKDPETGKMRQETRKFVQTINPFNRNEDGSIKTRSDILRDIKIERDKWLAAQGEGRTG